MAEEDLQTKPVVEYGPDGEIVREPDYDERSRLHEAARPLLTKEELRHLAEEDDCCAQATYFQDVIAPRLALTMDDGTDDGQPCQHRECCERWCMVQVLQRLSERGYHR